MAAATIRTLGRLFWKTTHGGTLTLTEVAASMRAPVLASRYHDDAGQKSDFSNYPVPEKEELPNDVQHRMSAMENKNGFLPNVFKAMTHRPDEFRGFFDIYCTIMNRDGGLSTEEKELVAVVTSVHNKCMYCVIAHGAVHRMVSGNPVKSDQLMVNPDLVNLTPREKAIVAYTRVVLELKPITDETYSNLREHGISREDAWDIGAITSLFSYSNRMSHALQVVPDDVFYTLGRQPTAAATALPKESSKGSEEGAVPTTEERQSRAE